MSNELSMTILRPREIKKKMLKIENEFYSVEESIGKR